MYNKYLQTACPPADAPPCPPPERQESGSILSSLGNLFEQDTLLVLLILYVLLKDETGGIDRDLLLLAGIFLLIGV